MKSVYAVVLAFTSTLMSQPLSQFYDDFNDGDISDWVERCSDANWYPLAGCVRGVAWDNLSTLIPLDGPVLENVFVETSVKGVHCFGVAARMDAFNCGLIAYVSPDDNIARIRAVSGGEPGTIYASSSGSFPSGVWYEMTLNCEGSELLFHITVPSTDQVWTLTAVDPSPHAGATGLAMGDEDAGNWDWFGALGIGCIPVPAWLRVDDDAAGESSGDGDMAFETGEEIELVVELFNDGTEALTGVTTVLQSLEPELVITDDYEAYPDIPAGSSAACQDDFGITALAGTPEGTVWPMKMLVLADGGFDAELYFDLPLGFGLVEDFEELPVSWTFAPVTSSWQDDWHLSTERNHTTGGGYSLKCGSQGTGDYSDDLYCMALSEPFNAPSGSILEYWQWIDTEVAQAPGFALDGGLIQVGQFDTWYTLEPIGGYPYRIPVGTTGPFEPNTSVYSGTVEWTVCSAVIPSALCGPLQLRYLFGSDAGGNREGWHVDDIILLPPAGIGEGESGQPVAASLSCSPNPSLGSVTFDITGLLPGGTVDVYDLSGRRVAQLPCLTDDGEASIVWGWTGVDGRVLGSGVYFARIPGQPLEAVRLIRLSL